MKNMFLMILFLMSWHVQASGVSAIFIVNGDASLSYYLDGKKFDGGLNALDSARNFALNCGDCEVAIFSLSTRARDKASFYRDEKLIVQKNYSRKKSGYRFEFESKWYKDHTDSRHEHLVLSFFGHELTIHPSVYFSSVKTTYGQSMFIEDMKKFLSGSEVFSLMILSTCQNGRASNVEKFAGITRFFVGSTINLNLRMIEVSGLNQAGPWDPEVVAKTIVNESFEEIARIDSTEIGIVSYDLECSDLCPYLKYRKNKFIGPRD